MYRSVQKDFDITNLSREKEKGGNKGSRAKLALSGSLRSLDTPFVIELRGSGKNKALRMREESTRLIFVIASLEDTWEGNIIQVSIYHVRELFAKSSFVIHFYKDAKAPIGSFLWYGVR